MSLETHLIDERRPVPTAEEVHEFLHYMDDLNAIRRFQTMSWRFILVFGIAHLLFGIGLAGGFIDNRFGLIAWVIVTSLLIAVTGHNFRARCPRCGKPFRYRLVFGIRIPDGIADCCAHCGLRALSQSDLRRFEAQQIEERAHTDT
ncbi:MAG: hypothetical protein KDA88_15275 [Planctomycetaceae bacterium]|nr:hypothetical protein [Planctomycetaceae bacterium]MCB9951766.1 hypothetical protein [Planctomycetaceae bacterium]